MDLTCLQNDTFTPATEFEIFEEEKELIQQTCGHFEGPGLLCVVKPPDKIYKVVIVKWIGYVLIVVMLRWASQAHLKWAFAAARSVEESGRILRVVTQDHYIEWKILIQSHYESFWQLPALAVLVPQPGASI